MLSYSYSAIIETDPSARSYRLLIVYLLPFTKKGGSDKREGWRGDQQVTAREDYRDEGWLTDTAFMCDFRIDYRHLGGNDTPIVVIFHVATAGGAHLQTHGIIS
jgi:hypothetical protein